MDCLPEETLVSGGFRQSPALSGLGRSFHPSQAV
jgi:hypothetical protein